MQQLKDSCPQLQADYDLVIKHVNFLQEQGHDIQLHFHPQWLYSNYDNNAHEWNLDLNHYKISDMKRGFAFDSFRAAKNLLDNTIGYKTTAFRAGGYCLDSFRDFQELFRSNGILIDSSVARNVHDDNFAHKFDYREIPQSIIYRFSNSITSKDDNGEFFELSISSSKLSFFKYLTRARTLQKNYKPRVIYKDGLSINSLEKSSVIKRILTLLNGKVYLASIDGVSSTMLPLYMDEMQRDTFVLIGHPKNATDASILCLKKFLLKNINNIRFKTTKDLRHETID
jgi:hypothetical protein